MNELQFTEELLSFIEQSPTPFHAVSNMSAMLLDAGFVCLSESDEWDLLRGQGYFTTRNDSSLIAFRLSNDDVAKAGFRMVGAHTDSPCLKVKPSPEINKNGYLQLGVEVYGGVLLNPWFDRDLSLAGRVNYVSKYRQMRHALIDFEAPVAVIPSLAIHLDPEVNKNRVINAQQHLPPIMLQWDKEAAFDFRDFLKIKLLEDDPGCNVESVLDYELCLYDVQPPALTGFNEEFISGARLDNLLSCYVGVKSLLQANRKTTALLVCTDHEEVGSLSASGAQGTFLRSVLERVAGTGSKLSRILDRSVLISTDNAHGLHPNYADKYDEKHGPILNKGPVIKVNVNQRYATNSETSAMFRQLCRKLEVPVQSFVVRSDMACGSTIGPITASSLGVKTLDVGVPQFAMHSIRETAGRMDAYYLYKVLTEFYSNVVDLREIG